MNLPFPIPLGMSPADRELVDRVNAVRVRFHGEVSPALVFAGNKFRCIVSWDHTHSGRRLHASVSHTKRYPSWEEIKRIRNWVFPDDVEVVMVFPKAGDYVNLSPNCFHLWQSACQGETG